MRRELAALWMCLAMASAAAPDDSVSGPQIPAADDAVKVVSLEAWQAELDAAESPNMTTIQRVAARRRLAGARLVRREGTVVDVKPIRDSVSIEVRTLREMDTSVTFSVPSDDAKSVGDWRKGDRVGWLERPNVSDTGDVELATDFTRLSDLSHSAEPPAPESETESADEATPEVPEAKDSPQPTPKGTMPRTGVVALGVLQSAVNEIRVADITAVERVRRFRALSAAKYRFQCTGAVIDVVPTTLRTPARVWVPNWVRVTSSLGYRYWQDQGRYEDRVREEPTVRIEVRGEGLLGAPTRTFVVPPKESEKAAKWTPRDVVQWSETVSVSDEGKIESVVVFKKLSDLKHIDSKK